jgi:alkanesulfonate monooxygenase SsuD/methylene tetrahydromethanopterin reductase-like flavin-dependent oxidoreductase (luciferase family)
VKLDTGLLSASLRHVPAAARAAEEIGFDALWTAEARHDPFLPLVLAAEHTTRVKLGTAIAVAFPRSPLVLAQIAWDLQVRSAGRFILDLGSGAVLPEPAIDPHRGHRGGQYGQVQLAISGRSVPCSCA